MITIVAKCKIKAGMAEEYKIAAKPLIEASQKEAGCIAYNLYEDIADPNVFAFIEHWEDQAAIDAHNNSEHVKQIVPRLRTFREESEINLYQKV